MPVYVTEVFNDFAEIADNLAPQAGNVVRVTIKRIEARAKDSLSGPRTGREYRRGKHGDIIHRASAPGEPPATDTGNLAGSIRSRMIARAAGEVTVSANYAVELEHGRARMAPRPFFGPAVQREWPEFVSAMERLRWEVR